MGELFQEQLDRIINAELFLKFKPKPKRDELRTIVFDDVNDPEIDEWIFGEAARPQTQSTITDENVTEIHFDFDQSNFGEKFEKQIQRCELIAKRKRKIAVFFWFGKIMQRKNARNVHPSNMMYFRFCVK